MRTTQLSPSASLERVAETVTPVVTHRPNSGRLDAGEAGLATIRERPAAPLGPVTADASLTTRERRLIDAAARSPEALLLAMSPEERAVIEQVSSAFSGGDPAILLASLTQSMGATGRTSSETALRAECESEVRASHERADSNKQARAAAKKAKRILNRMPPWVKKLVTSVIVAASAAATAVTGGVAAGLAIAGAVLIIGADGVEAAAKKLGMDPRKAGLLALGVRVAGAVLMAGAGFAGAASAASGAASTARSSVDVAQKVLQQTINVFNSARATDDTARNLVAAVHTKNAELASTDATQAQFDADRARSAMEALVDALRQGATTQRTMLGHVQAILDARVQTRESLMQRIV